MRGIPPVNPSGQNHGRGSKKQTMSTCSFILSLASCRECDGLDEFDIGFVDLSRLVDTPH
jgi:hypothetical protein